MDCAAVTGRVQDYLAGKGRKIIGIRYKDNIADGITDVEIAKGRKERRKSPLTGYPYEIYVGDLAMPQQKLCDLLNSKLNKKS